MAQPESTGSRPDNPDAIVKMAGGFQVSRIVLTAYELGIWTAVDQGGQTSDDVARKLNTAPRATDRLMNALCALGLLQKSEGRFSNTPASEQYLVEGKPEFIGMLGHMANLWKTWSTLTEAVRLGTTVVGGAPDEHDREWLNNFIQAMDWRARHQADRTVELLDLSDVSRVLDVGGGSAAYSRAFVRARECITATVFDLAPVLPITRKYIREADLEDKIDTRAGDLNATELGRDYDLVFCSAIVHSNSFEENERFMEKAFRALRPGGRVVVRDFIMDGDRTTPPFGAVFALNMLVATRAGDTFTESDVKGWLHDAGFEKIERIDEDPTTAMIVGRKPKQ